MADSSRSSRPSSTIGASASASARTSINSLLQDVPGAFPPSSQAAPANAADIDDEVAYPTLHQIVHARRGEYVERRRVRIKVGTWNIAALKGAEKDLGGWFVGGEGLAESLPGSDLKETSQNEDADKGDTRSQEKRYSTGQSTLPKGDHLVLPKDKDVGLYVLGLQEVVDINSATEALRPFTDSSVASKWKGAMETALPDKYTLVAEQQLIGLLLLIYAAPEVAKDIKSVSTTSIGTGLMGYMGNKGAVTARLVLGDTTRLVFVNCHLAAGADKSSLERRNWDAQQIVSRTRFEPIQDSMDLTQNTGEQIGDEDFAFWCGDLNYRLEGVPGEDVRKLLMLHTRNEYDLSQQAARQIEQELENSAKPAQEGTAQQIDHDSLRASTESRRSIAIAHDLEAAEDPTSLQTTLSSLLPHDELRQQMKARKAFHDGWQEGAITFLPTYKYDAGSVAVFDSSDKKRAPSWCDRIIYRTRKNKAAYESKIQEEEKIRKMDEQWKANGLDQAADDEEVLYNYDPETDGTYANGDYDENDDYNEVQDGVVTTNDGFMDEISLEYYTAHQKIISSDHKPLDACFMLEYDSVVPALKTRVHAEVAKELDKAENESRPNLTVVVDGHNDTPAASEQCLPEKFEGVWFGDVRWAQGKHRSLTVANTSRVPTTFSFIERPADTRQQPGIAPDWLKVEVNGIETPSSMKRSEPITLEPGEASNIDLGLRILSMDDVRQLNDDQRELEDILVLRVENGRDHFIPIRGHWLESSLGRSLDKLIRIPEGGIRKLQRQKPEGSNRPKSTAKPNSPIEKQVQQNRISADSAGGNDPVRFSAPRELFRLTEAVEELSVRVIAEWEMLHAPITPASSPVTGSSSVDGDVIAAPWELHPSWPFSEESWTDRQACHWTDALSEACNALDEDSPLETSLPSDLPRMQRLYILSNLLILFLSSIAGGIIGVDQWVEIERYVADTEKSKHRSSNEDQRSAIQEILSRSTACHCVSFVLVMGTLERMLVERAHTLAPAVHAGTSNHSRNQSSDSTHSFSTTPLSPTQRTAGALKRIVTGRTSSATSPQSATGAADAGIKAFSHTFADLIIRAYQGVGSSEKTKALAQKRKIEVIEAFLQRDSV